LRFFCMRWCCRRDCSSSPSPASTWAAAGRGAGAVGAAAGGLALLARRRLAADGSALAVAAALPPPPGAPVNPAGRLKRRDASAACSMLWLPDGGTLFALGSDVGAPLPPPPPPRRLPSSCWSCSPAAAVRAVFSKRSSWSTRACWLPGSQACCWLGPAAAAFPVPWPGHGPSRPGSIAGQDPGLREQQVWQAERLSRQSQEAPTR
jgi:hypothetical protein